MGKVNSTTVQVGGVTDWELSLFRAYSPRNAIGEGCQSFQLSEGETYAHCKLNADSRNLTILK